MGELRKMKALLMREVLGVRRNVLLLLLIVVLPIAFGVMFGTFKEFVPRSTPSMLAPEDESVGADDMRFANFTLALFSTPVIGKNNQTIVDALLREEVYFGIVVPSGVREAKGVIEVYVDSSMAPVAEASDYVVGMIRRELREWNYYPTFKLVKVGRPIMPLEFFVPGIIILLIAAAGFLVLPFSTMRDSVIFDRLLTNVSLTGIALSKLIFGLALALIQVFFLLTTQRYMDAAIIEINLWSVYVLIASALSFTALGLAFVFLARFSELGRYLNVLAFGAVVVLSGIFYPIGFMPQIIQTVCKLTPTYYSVLLVRYFGVKGGGYTLVGDYVGVVTVFALACLALLVFSIWRLRRG